MAGGSAGTRGAARAGRRRIGRSTVDVQATIDPGVFLRELPVRKKIRQIGADAGDAGLRAHAVLVGVRAGASAMKIGRTDQRAHASGVDSGARGFGRKQADAKVADLGAFLSGLAVDRQPSWHLPYVHDKGLLQSLFSTQGAPTSIFFEPLHPIVRATAIPRSPRILLGMPVTIPP